MSEVYIPPEGMMDAAADALANAGYAHCPECHECLPIAQMVEYEDGYWYCPECVQSFQKQPHAWVTCDRCGVSVALETAHRAKDLPVLLCPECHAADQDGCHAGLPEPFVDEYQPIDSIGGIDE